MDTWAHYKHQNKIHFDAGILCSELAYVFLKVFIQVRLVQMMFNPDKIIIHGANLIF